VITAGLYAAKAPPLAYALAMPVGALFAAACCAFRGWRLVRDVVADLGRQLLRPRRFPGTKIAGTAAPMFVIMLGLPIALQSDRIVIAHRLDPSSLSNYSYAVQLYTPLWSLVSVAALALWPVFASPQHACEGLRRSWLTGLSILGSAGLVIAVGYLLLAGVVISWMSGGAATPSFFLLFAFAMLLLVQSVHVTTGILLISPRQLKFQALCVALLVVTNLPMSWALAPPLGAAGPVVASALTVAACQLVPGLLMALKVTSPSAKARLDHAVTRRPA
jgi:O-antigen/teichoic acid export membrane protein